MTGGYPKCVPETWKGSLNYLSSHGRVKETRPSPDIISLNQTKTISPMSHNPPMNPSQLAISNVCDEVKGILLVKNLKYGDAALNPIRVFSKANTLEQLNVRIDDKINRIMNRRDDEDEDPELDLIGYLILKRAHKRLGSITVSAEEVKSAIPERF